MMTSMQSRYIVAFCPTLLSYQIIRNDTKEPHSNAYRHKADAEHVAGRMNAGMVRFEPLSDRVFSNNYAKGQA